jgi:tagaturonate reductase
MKGVADRDGNYTGRIKDKKYAITDDFAENLYLKWNSLSGLSLVQSVLSDKDLWDIDLNELKGFSESVLFYLESLNTNGFFGTVELLK